MLLIKEIINMETDKLISIYKTKKEYKLYPSSLNQYGFWNAISPCYVLSITCDLQNLARSIKEALTKSNIAQITFDKDKDYDQSLKLHELGVKTWSELYRTSKSCTLSLNHNILKLTPYKHEGRKGNFPIVEKIQTFFVDDFENAVLGVIEILNDKE